MEQDRGHITAEWARKTANEVLGEKVKLHIKSCLDAIEKAVKSNQNSTKVYLNLEPLAKSDLEKRGFNVEQHYARGMRDDNSVTITW